MAQQAVEHRGIEKHEFVRTARMALYGGGKIWWQWAYLLEIMLNYMAIFFETVILATLANRCYGEEKEVKRHVFV